MTTIRLILGLVTTPGISSGPDPAVNGTTTASDPEERRVSGAATERPQGLSEP